jgi:small subunit ribosomal protein S15
MNIMSPVGTAEEAIKALRLHEADTGSPQVQVVRLTHRVNELAVHLQVHKKDVHSRHGLLMMVSRRRRLLEDLKRHDEDTYRKLLDALKLRK